MVTMSFDKNIQPSSSQNVDFHVIFKELKAELMTIVDYYGLSSGKDLKQAIASGKISEKDVKQRVEEIMQRKFAKIFNLDSLDDLESLIKSKQINSGELGSFINNFLAILSFADIDFEAEQRKNKFNFKPLSNG